MRSGRSRFYKLLGGTIRHSMTIEAWMGTPRLPLLWGTAEATIIAVLWLESCGGNLRGRDQSIRVD